MKSIRFLLFIISTFVSSQFFTQNEAAKWYFGQNAALDFMTSPPTPLIGSAMIVLEGCASVADANGNLLFYTDGMTIWTSTHTVMANGTGLFGNGTPTQSSLIIRRPGSTTLYYVFTVQPYLSNNAGFFYSIVDMSLAAGQGSVTVKNAPIYTSNVGEKLTGTKHCNGVDYWVVVRDWTLNSNNQRNFRSYQFSATGVNTTAVISPSWTWTTTLNYNDLGAMKISPNGKKLGTAVYNYYNQNISNHAFELYDFDNSTGVVSNSLALHTTTTTNNYNYGYGCEFSPDGTKFYGSQINSNVNNQAGIWQWNLCAGSNSAIAASLFPVASFSNNVNNWHGSMQVAPNGKIYCATWWGNGINQSSISVVHNPNALGAACNYSFQNQSVGPGLSRYGLPNFVGSIFAQPPPIAPFTHTVSNTFGCQGVAFTSPIGPNTTVSACSSIGYSLTSLAWNFGDPLSGGNNVSFAQNPIHAFTNLGTYTVQLVLYYSCGGGTDTLRQVVNVNQPCISVASTSITCASLGSATVSATGGVGPFSYTWQPTGQTNSVATGLSPGTYTLTVFDFGNNFTYTATTVFTSLIPLTGSISTATSITCNGANTGTGSVTDLAGGSGSEFYIWTNGINTYTTAFTNSLSAGLWTVSVTDATTGCNINQLFFISQPPPLNLVLSSSSQSACVNDNIVLSGTSSGGTPAQNGPAYTYSWVAGPASDTRTVTAANGGGIIYTLQSRDSLNCLISNTIAVNFVNKPVLSVANVSICPLQTGNLVVSGASSYTWNSNFVGSIFSDNPTSNSVYTVVGEALACTSTATASIILYPSPTPLYASNSPVCNGKNLLLFSGGGVAYQWQGPMAFNSTLNSPTITAVDPNYSGVYNLTVTSVHGCTAATNGTVTINPTPTLSALGGDACTNGTLNLVANSNTGASYFWRGPLSYTSSNQNPSITNPSLARTGIYTVTATSTAGCTNSTVVQGSITLLPIASIASDGPKCELNTINFSGNGGNMYSWIGPAGFSSNLKDPVLNSVNVSSAGIYSLTVFKGPCVAGTSYSLTVFPLPVPTANSSSQVCETKTLNLYGSANKPVNYAWYGPGGFYSPMANPVRTLSTLNYSGTYTLVVVDANLCQATALTQVNILANPTISAVGATVCLNEEAVISAEGADSYYWTGPGFFQSGAQYAQIASVTKNLEGTYTVVGTAANSCTNTTTVSVNTRELPVPQYSVFPNATLCVNDVLTFVGDGGKSFKWYGPNNNFYEGASVTFTTSVSHIGNYTLVATDETGCVNQTEVQVVINKLPQGYLMTSAESGCVPFCADYMFSSSSGSAAITSVWENNKRVFGEKFSHCFNETGIHTFTGIITDEITGCESTAVTQVTVFPQPIANFYYSPLNPLENEQVIFTNTSESEGTITSNWFFDSNKGYKTTSTNVSRIYEAPGKYPVALVITNSFGCSDTVMKAIIVEPDFTIYVPNAFTPNLDGLNDVFEPVFHSTKKYSMQVFDRWGSIIYNSTDGTKGWDGTNKGVFCKSDVYTWKIEVKDVNAETKLYSGHVTLIR